VVIDFVPVENGLSHFGLHHGVHLAADFFEDAEQKKEHGLRGVVVGFRNSGQDFASHVEFLY
jgi:hypothetical protein